MVEVQIVDNSNVVIDGITYSGPLHLYGPAVTVGTTTVTAGYVLVKGGSHSLPLGDATALEAQVAGPLLWFSLLCGVAAAKLILRS
jgi:hypothetical protein